MRRIMVIAMISVGYRGARMINIRKLGAKALIPVGIVLFSLYGFLVTTFVRDNTVTNRAKTARTVSDDPGMEDGTGDVAREPKGISAAVGTAETEREREETRSHPGAVFAVIGDTQRFTSNPSGNLQRAVASLSKCDIDAVFVMGDLVSSCDGTAFCASKFENWKRIMAPMLARTYEVRGNHDRSGGNGTDILWRNAFDLPMNGPDGFVESAYSLDIGNAHFVVLDSEKPEEHVVNGIQRGWLEQDLERNTKENVFVFVHEPAFRVSRESKDILENKPDERDAFWDILKRHAVTAVFNGHVHFTAGKVRDGIHQFFIGDTDGSADDTPDPKLTDFGLKGHYYSIVTVTGRTVDLKFYSVDGKMAKEYSFSN